VVSEIEQALVALKPGQVLNQPVRSRFGWHVLKLDRRIEGRELPFEYVEDKIRLHLESRAWTAAATRYVSDLADRARGLGVAFSLTRDGRFDTGALSLGERLAGASAAGLEAWLDTCDPDLATRVRTAASAAGVDVETFVQRAVQDFVNTAGDESWTHLISAAQGAEDPAIAAIASLLRTRLTPKARTYTIFRKV
jgi:peptidyl-prolyl cis-trans isomerase C